MEDPRSEAKALPHIQDLEANRYKQLAQTCEILSVLALTAGVALFWRGIKLSDALEGFAAMIPFGFAIGLFFAAARCSSKADSALERSTKESLYLISSHRIETLRQVKAPKDVTGFLRSIEHPSPRTQDQLLRELQTALGSERTKEIKDIVLKYTRLDVEESPDSSQAAVRVTPASV
jgi:hypothetical protein